MIKRIPPAKLCNCCESEEIDTSVSDYYCRYCYEDKHKEVEVPKACQICGRPAKPSWRHYYCKKRRGII